MSKGRKLSRAFNVEGLRRLACSRLPRPIFDYLDGGADDERTLRRNTDAFADYELIPDVLADVSSIRISTRLFGREVAMPLMLSPTGLTRMFHSLAEPAVARPAERHGLLYALSTLGTTRIEELAEISKGPKVFQIYLFRDRGLTAEFIARCKAADYDGLVVTVDTPVTGNRERDRASGLSLPPALTLKSFMAFALHPRWSLGALFGSKFDFINVSHRVDALADGPMSLFDYIGGQFDRTVTWRDLEWLASEWGRPIAVKGVMNPADARRAIEHGSTGLIVSNHGGRQLDGAPAPVDQIAVIREAVGQGPDVICDGGVRRGSDIVKALALGATACAIGRPYLYGLSAAGEAGVDKVLTLFRDEFERTLALMGINDIGAIEQRHVRRRGA